jgi:dihydrofolate synthase/folylpolyglutamate synthase
MAEGRATQADIEAYFASQIDFEKLLGTNKLANTERDFQLAEFRRLLLDLGSPHQAYPVIHVAGTKGKGSTCAMIASILRAHGLRVGQYSSPHLERYTERIQINGEEISPSRLGQLLITVRNRASRQSTGDNQPDGWRTLFEQMTASAFLHFTHEKVDVAVIETGLGGRLDATNVHHVPGPHPVVAVITTIGMDHMAILGDTPYQIACEKMAIIHGHNAVVIGPQVPEFADQVQRAESERLSSIKSAHGTTPTPIIHCEPDLPFEILSPDDFREQALLTIPHNHLAPNPLPVSIGLAGEHQVNNARTAVAALVALERLLNGSLTLQPQAIQQGLRQVQWPARFEVLDRQRPVILDGAHCPLSVHATCRTLVRHLVPHDWNQLGVGPQPMTLVLGLMRDKDLPAMINAVRECGLLDGRAGIVFSTIIATQADWPRAIPAPELAQNLSQICPPGTAIESIPNPEEAFAKAITLGHGVLGFGSLYLPAHFRRGFHHASVNCS